MKCKEAGLAYKVSVLLTWIIALCAVSSILAMTIAFVKWLLF